MTTEDSTYATLRQLIKDCWQISQDHGWHQESADSLLGAATLVAAAEQAGEGSVLHPIAERARASALRTKGVPVMQKLMLIVSEVSEACEVFRDVDFELDKPYAWKQDQWLAPYPDDVEPPVKPEGFGSELADVVIRVFDLAEDLGIDLARELQRKIRYNKSRPFRHGGKHA